MNYPAWQIKTADPAAEQALAGAGCGALLRRVLAARGCTRPRPKCRPCWEPGPNFRTVPAAGYGQSRGPHRAGRGKRGDHRYLWRL